MDAFDFLVDHPILAASLLLVAFVHAFVEDERAARRPLL